MRARLATAILGIPFVLTAIWFGSPWLTAIVILLAVLGCLEFFNLAQSVGRNPITVLGLVLAASLALNGDFEARYLLPILGGGILASLVWLTWRSRIEGAINDWALTLAGPLYTGWTLSHILLVRDLDQGREWLLLGVLATFVTDTTAFVVGHLFGRRPLAPNISPAKTWEGAISGFCSAVVVAPIFGIILELPLSLWESIALGGIIGVAAQLGDLVESLFKRSVGAKDTGSLIPGHGGVLDRLDSVAITMVLLYHFCVWWVR